MRHDRPPPLKLWQGALIALLVALGIWVAYVLYHIYWGAFAH